MPEEPRLEEQALSQVAKLGLSSQIDGAEALEVDVRTDLSKLVQGQADSVSVKGQGLILQKDIRVEQVEVQSDRVMLNPLSALFGNLKLDHPVDADLRMQLTEADLNQAMNSDYVQSRLQPLNLLIDGETVPVELQPPMEIRLPGDGKLQFSGMAELHEPNNSHAIHFSAVIVPRTADHPVLLEEFRCHPCGVSIDFTIALMQAMKEIVNLPYVQIDGMVIRVKKLTVESGSLTIQTEAHVYQIPSR